MTSQLRDSPMKMVKLGKDETLIPEDIILQSILPRLPIKSALHCQLVSKTWYNFLTHPLFTRLQLHHSASKSRNTTTFIIFATRNKRVSILRRPRFILHDDEHHSMPEVSSICFVRSTKTIEPARIDDARLKDVIVGVIRKFGDGHLFEVIGVCSGVFCLAYGASVVLLWNPAIKEVILIEYSFSQFRTVNHVRTNAMWCIGFGDVKDGYGNVVNFKLLTMARNFQNAHLFSVYSLNTNKWSLVNSPSFGIERILVRGCAFLNGVLHWLAWGNDTKRSAFVLTFDIINETFGRIEFPTSNELILVRGWDNFLTVIDGEYLLLAVAAVEAEGTCLTFWVLVEDGCKKQWIRSDKFLGPLSIKGGSLLGYWADGNAVIANLRKRICFHAQDLCIEHETEFKGVLTCWEYAESLVSPKRISDQK